MRILMRIHTRCLAGGSTATQVAVGALFCSVLGGSALAQRAISVDDLPRLAKVNDPQVSRDEQTLYYAVARARLDLNRWQSALYAQSLGRDHRPSGPARQLTFPERTEKKDGSDSSPQLSQDERWLLFLSSRDGNAPQVYGLALPGGGEARKLTNFPSGVGAFRPSPDGQGFLAQSRVSMQCAAYPSPKAEPCNRARIDNKDPARLSVRVMDRLLYRHWDGWDDGLRSHLFFVPTSGDGGTGGVPIDLTPSDDDSPPLARGGDQPFGLSPDGRELAFVSNRSPDLSLSTNNDIFLVSLDAMHRPVTAPWNITGQNPATDTSPRYSPDGRYLAFLSQRRAGFESDRFELMLMDRKTRSLTPLTPQFEHTLFDIDWSPDSKALFLSTTVGGRATQYLLTLGTGSGPSLMMVGEANSLSSFAGEGGARHLYFTRSSLQRPAEVFFAALDAEGKPAGAAVPLTRTNGPLLEGLALGTPSELFATSQDGLKLQAHLMLPPGFSPKNKYPAVVLIHGGPQGVWDDFWQWRWNAQIFAGAGYVVLMPNPRGSEGFGQKFVDEVSRDWPGKAYDDLMRLVDQLVAQPYVDGRKVAAMGASYGGYMVNWIAGHSDRFACLVSHAGVFDLRSMYLETEETWFPRWEFGGDPWTTDRYTRHSPSMFADRFKTPTLVISNERDYRVPVGQGMQFFTALQVRKVPSRLIIFPDENHWVLKPGNAHFWYTSVLDWLQRYLGGAPGDQKFLERAGTYSH